MNTLSQHLHTKAAELNASADCLTAALAAQRVALDAQTVEVGHLRTLAAWNTSEAARLEAALEPPAGPQSHTVRNSTGAPGTASPGSPITLVGANDEGTFTLPVQESKTIPAGNYSAVAEDGTAGIVHIGTSGSLRANGGAFDFLAD